MSKVPHLTYSGTKHQTIRMKVTPKIATAWLDGHNTYNRPVRRVNLNRIAEAMTKGKYHIGTGESLKFGKDGTLQDGQHRLHGVVKSGKTIEFDITVNLDDNAQKFMDNGARRSMSDRVGLSVQETAVVNFLWKFHIGTKNESPKMRGSHEQPTADEIEKLFKKNETAIRNLMEYRAAGGHVIPKINAAPIIAGLLPIGEHLSYCDEWFAGFHEGLGLENDSPAFVLRQFLIAHGNNTFFVPYGIYHASRAAADAWTTDQKLNSLEDTITVMNAWRIEKYKDKREGRVKRRRDSRNNKAGAAIG